jgi:cysteinyl-tRNA synthetase
MSSSPELRLYNTLTRKKERFEPIDPANVRVYACGPTVYDHLHIGNGRMLVVFDVLFRLLRHLCGEDRVTYVRNITDVDDKINERAAERGIDIRALTDEMIAVFHADAKALGCLPPTIEPRATDHIDPMLEIIGKLIERGHAYAAEGHVLFDVPSDADYGKLSRRPLDEMIAGARVEVAPYKRSPTDFVLWKPSVPGEPAWDSPWGRGRPGWHLECSAMSWKHLGEIFDIHGGGIDLVFPHHENEIAQTCSAFGHDVMANYWMHNGHLQVEGEKMSKSLGNFVTIHELLHSDKFGGRSWPGEVLRLALLRTHYRQPIDFTVRALKDAYDELRAWSLHLLSILERNSPGDPWAPILAHQKMSGLTPSPQLVTSLKDDLNCPQALTFLRATRPLMSSSSWADCAKFLMDAEFLGVLDRRTASIFANGVSIGQTSDERLLAAGEEIRTAELNRNSSRVSEIVGKLIGLGIYVAPNGHGCWQIGEVDMDVVKQMIRDRLAARAAKNWKESDRIRDELAAMGIALKDNKDGTTTWEVKR